MYTVVLIRYSVLRFNFLINYYCDTAFSEHFLNVCVNAEGLNAVKGLHVDMDIVETNIVSALIYLDLYLILTHMFLI